VHTVDEVCETEIDEMFVNVKSVPLVVDTEEQSIWPDVAVNVNVNDEVDEFEADAASTTVGAADEIVTDTEAGEPAEMSV
jgi:hypothetical protein